ncbi:MAG TPA: hypothetical protein VKQ06_07155 [Gammaproteobacteria bacterium]|nr:hypothetical protein [Gammaproteobacteria bacterium]
MDDIRKQIKETLEQLKQERDEIRVKVHLAKMDASDEWKTLETKLARLEGKAREIGGATAESGKEVGAAAKLLAEEVRDGLKNIARHF